MDEGKVGLKRLGQAEYTARIETIVVSVTYSA